MFIRTRTVSNAKENNVTKFIGTNALLLRSFILSLQSITICNKEYMCQGRKILLIFCCWFSSLDDFRDTYFVDIDPIIRHFNIEEIKIDRP